MGGTMITNDFYRRLRYRADDPLRYLHVPKREREDVDTSEHENGLDDPADVATEADR